MFVLALNRPIIKRLPLAGLLIVLLVATIFLGLSRPSNIRPTSPKPQNIKTIALPPSHNLLIASIPTTLSLPAIIITLGSTAERGKTYYINPQGQDSNDGLSVNTPFQTIQQGLKVATSDDLIYLFPGMYPQNVVTVRNGLPEAPITITGPKEAVVTGGGATRVFEVQHSYITLDGFTLDGQFGEGSSKSGFRDKLLYILSREPRSGVTGLKVTNMAIQNAGGECIRLRYFAHHNEISSNTIKNCGIHDFRFSDGGKNGEGIYIGTAPEQRDDGKNPTGDFDESNNNWIHDNIIDTQGNECVDIKESSSGNLVENNRCSGQKDPNSGGMDSRGSGNTFRHNTIFNNTGAGIRLGGDSNEDGINNNIYGNRIQNSITGGIKFERIPQGKICGNIMFQNQGGNSVGEYGSQINPTARCP